MSMSDLEQGSRAFRRQCRRIDLLSPMSAYATTLAYLSLIFDLGMSESIRLVGCLVGCAILAGLIGDGRRRFQMAPIVRFLDHDLAGVSGSRAGLDASSAFRAIVSLPLQMQRTRFYACFASIAIVPLLMWAMGFDAWLGLDRIRSVVMVSLVSSLMSGVLLFYWTKQSIAGLRVAIASVAGDSATRSGLVEQYSLQRKILLVAVIPVLASVLLVMDVFNVKTRSYAEDKAILWAMTVVESVAYADDGLPIDVRIANQLPQEKFWPMPLETIEIRSDRRDGDSTVGVSEPFLDALDRELELGGTIGPLAPDFGPEIGAFRRLDDDRILISKVQRSDLESQRAALDWAVGIVCLGVLGVAMLMGRLASADISTGLEALESAAERMVAGDLVEGVGYESEDELGSLGRALDSVGNMLRTTIARISTSADSAERIAAGASGVMAGVAATSATQIQLVQRVSQLMATINARVGETSGSVEDLASTIDESASSLLELGATGDELNQTASVLTSNVDDVSNSLEQMVGNVKQVAGNTEKLATASEETSSSMEVMAKAIRAVDTSAETTADLSREVVEKAELGQAKVVQTIAGMEAIRDATDVAENVIRGLGDRTSEIGGILDVIDDVADETNLLALNAAIIAAQAGEHGKAFSVVADEIKDLADRVLASTKEIGGLIRAVQDESENAVGAIEAGSASVMSGVDLSAEAGRTLEEITVASRESGRRIGEIVDSVREQTKGASRVVDLMERVRDSAEKIGAAGAEQDQRNEIVYQSAQAIREIAQQVCRTTAEQTLEFGRLRENVVDAREAAEQIKLSMGEQSGACRQVTESIGLVSQGIQSNEESAGRMRETMRELVLEAERLREGAERFRV
jgi:methyl-accepting chemotaxis protein